MNEHDQDEAHPETIEDDAFETSALPLVAGAKRDNGMWFASGGALFLGLVTFLTMAAQRRGSEAQAHTALPLLGANGAAIVAPDFPDELAAFEAEANRAAYAASAPPQLVITTTPPVPIATQVAFTAPPGPDASALRERRRAPALVVDLGTPGASVRAGADDAALVAASDVLTPEAPAQALADASPREAFVSPDEGFAARVGAAEPESEQATVLRNLDAIVPQGAMIPGVLETALNSDLPGYARAVVSRDVRSFDGSRVLVPRGSRVIGQYSSGVSLGQSRVFVIWTRVITPDGVSIQIASPGADALGRAGMDGDVDRHFFQRFSGSLLLSVLNAATASVIDQPSTQIVIGSSQDASRLGASVLSPTNIPPTIEVPQGTPIRIFVVRDLDFSDAMQTSARRRSR